MDAAPRIKGSGITLLVIGILELIGLIIVLAALGGKSSDTNANLGTVSSWWEPTLSAAGFITTGSLAIAASVGRQCNIATIVVASLSLAWTCIKVLIFLLALVALAAAQSTLDDTDGINSPENGAVVNAAMGILWAVVGIGFTFSVVAFGCLIHCIVGASRIVCCRGRTDQMGIIIHEAPVAVNDPYGRPMPVAVTSYPYAQNIVI